MKENMTTNNKPAFEIFVVREGSNKKSYFSKIGAAWPTKSGSGYNADLIALPVDAPRFASIGSVDDLPRRMKEEIESFLVASTVFEHKALTFGGWSGANAAYDLVEASVRSGAE